MVPRNYEIGGSSGWWGIAKSPELLGLATKTASVTTLGVNYVQVDFENTSEFFEPDVVERLRQVVDDLQIKWGAHGEIGEFMSWEAAVEAIWKQSHRRLHQYLDGFYDFFLQRKGGRPDKDYARYVPEYVNFHASNMPPIGIFIERYRFGGHNMLDFKGRDNWDDLIRSNQKLYEWFSENMLVHFFARESATVYYSEEDVIRAALERYILPKMIEEGKLAEDKWKEKYSEYVRKYIEEKDPATRKEVHDKLYQIWLEMSRLKNLRGAVGVEEWAYAIVAKYMEYTGDPLWEMYFGKKSMEDLEREWSETTKGVDHPGKKVMLFDKERGVVNLMPEIVAMVASKYIIGHFDAHPLPEFLRERRLEFEREGKKWDEFYTKTAREKLSIIKTIFTFETPEIIENQREGLQRIIRARHIYYLVKAFNSPYIRGWFDSEHYLHNGLDPIEEIKSCPDDMGKYFLGFHVGAPKPYHPVHEPIDVGSEAQRWIYIYMWHMRKKGFGVGNRAIVVFERGGARGGQSPLSYIGQSATAIRLIVDELEKDTRPEDLPITFFGVSPEGMHSMEKQMAIMREHYWDPLKGLIAVPEEEHTFFGKSAIDKGKRGDDFKKEELR